jgi:hypothetical protein
LNTGEFRLRCGAKGSQDDKGKVSVSWRRKASGPSGFGEGSGVTESNMKNRLYLLSIFAITLIPFVGPWEGASSAMSSQATKGIPYQAAYKNAASFMPVLDTDMSNLDVRDAQNRPVSQANSQQELAALFMDSLFEMSVIANTHLVQAIWQDIELYSHLFRDLIWNVYYPLIADLPEALLRASKRFVHNVHNVWITLLLQLVLCSLLSATVLIRSCQHSVILRC